MFAAQGRRHLSQYRNTEIKGLLAHQLGLDEIGRLGGRAQEVARGLKSGLGALRIRQSEISDEEDRVRADLEALHGVEQVVAAAMQECHAARNEFNAAQLAQARLLTERRSPLPPMSRARGWRTGCDLLRQPCNAPRSNGSNSSTIHVNAPID